VGRPKLVSAYARLSALNPEVRLVPHDARLSSANALEVVRAYDIVVDGTDNFATRYLVNDACVLTGRPNVYGSIFRFEGQASVFAVRGGPCYRCLHPEPPPPGLVPNCAEGGVLGVLPGVIGTIQATEAIKMIVGIGDPLVGRFLIYDALRMRFRELTLRRDPECPVCGDRPSIRELQDYERVCGDATPAEPDGTMQDVDMTALDLKARLDRGDAPFLLDVREPRELAISRIEGATLIPLGDLPRRLAELPADRDIVVICRTGARSARAVGFLRERGFHRARNLRGGMHEWTDKVDPTQVKY
jgi:adenylyltransferase/sulfurtransferase